MHRLFPYMSWLLALLTLGCQPAAERMQERLEEAGWTFGGCADVVLTAVSSDETLAIELRLEVDTSDLLSQATYHLEVDDEQTSATLYDGEGLTDVLCTSAESNASSEVHRAYEASDGEIDLTVTQEPNGGRTASASARALTFKVGRDTVRIDLEFAKVIIGQY